MIVDDREAFRRILECCWIYLRFSVFKSSPKSASTSPLHYNDHDNVALFTSRSYERSIPHCLRSLLMLTIPSRQAPKVMLLAVVISAAVSDPASSEGSITLWSPHAIISHHESLHSCAKHVLLCRLSSHYHNEMPADRVQKSRSTETVPALGDPDRKRMMNVLAQRRYRKCS